MDTELVVICSHPSYSMDTELVLVHSPIFCRYRIGNYLFTAPIVYLHKTCICSQPHIL